MSFSSPVPFKEAIASRAVKTALPTSLSSKEIQDALSAELRERAMFSARMTDLGFLRKVNDLATRIVSPETITEDGVARPARPGEYMDKATARLQLKEAIRALGFHPGTEGVAPGSIKDFSSDARLNLILDTNVRMAQGYGFFQQGQDPAVLDEWPAQELFRAETREKPRDWASRWSAAGGKFFDGGRMIALKNDPVWSAISAFGLPYPPFDYNSGMDVRDIDRAEAVALGLVTEKEAVLPADRGLNDDLSVPVDERAAQLVAEVVKASAGALEFVKGVLKLKGS